MASQLALPVPPGFTITTEACRAYLAGRWPAGLDDEIDEHLAGLEAATGRRLGDPADPLLVSVRSGAAVSMPGMLDTVLDLGLHAGAVEGLAARTGSPSTRTADSSSCSPASCSGSRQACWTRCARGR